MPFLTVPLNDAGPLIDVGFALSSYRIDVMKQAGMADMIYREPVWVTALIDTGSNISVINRHVIETLSLSSTGNVNVRSAVSGMNSELRDTYDVCLAFAKPRITPMHANLRVVEGSFFGKSFEAIIGRDILCKCLFFYDGPDQKFSLSFF